MQLSPLVREEQEIVDVEALSETSILGFSDDGRGIQEAGVMYQAMNVQSGE